MARDIDNTADVIDSRDIIARIEELEAEREALSEALQEHRETLEDADASTSDERAAIQDDIDAAESALKEWDESDEASELKVLKALADEAEGYAPDWSHGEALIRDTYFKEYAQELAEDIGAINKDASWPNTCIDWDEAADQLKQDYTSVDYDGVEYWIRS